MKQTFRGKATEDLIKDFAENCVKQYEADLSDEISRYNDLYDEMVTIIDELRRQKPDARIALQKLYEHPNIQVRLQAARLTLGVLPTEARRVIESISQSAWMPQAADAGMTLRALDEGIFKPT
jgi:hypothetical protein